MYKRMKPLFFAALALIGLMGTARAEFDAGQSIDVISREEGSGTRGAFVELTGVEQRIDGKKVDMTTEDAQITNNTSAMLMTVAGDERAIGYVSLGSLGDTVKAVKVGGVEATAENVASGAYAIARPFNIAYREEGLSALAEDFIAYVMSEEGQTVVGENGYVGAEGAAPYEGSEAEGKLVIGGSSSISPVMEKLIEAYTALHPKAEIELQTTDSTTGMTLALEGAYDIGMASRALKEDEAAQLASRVIAMDGIAVIVSKSNPAEDLTAGQIGSIFLGEITRWSDVLE